MRAPVVVINTYCARVGIPFVPAALSWQPSERPEWELSRRWHAEVAESTGFGGAPASQSCVDVERDPVLGGYLSHHLPYYQALHARRLVPV